ncbi:tRNA pseudouridine(38-40) synthase TruA [Geobacter sp. SVR]|uniref:tRNA pseudouridine(38-40) synthase TruA n=1 Tax=Geobacter sp. SVR TaxID=2495594 RepID=UPI00143EFB7C|nr:tRNA pseudouridine(38-40) synthase TruA [Geobacter sp. SVR]BCS51991.1 tRNA pseudouridine synthase A [Geobacter sp. SVR]GCF87194.1 tRNA pseudouridine synthase A [Geobacter sp. SVR]
MRAIRLTIEYDGTAYAGWQIQPNGLAVQQVIEGALQQLLGEAVSLRSSGRTDAGVHAAGMVAAFATTRQLPLIAFVEGTNRFLPPDIVILDAAEVAPGFRPIADAVAKHYRYTVYNSTVRSPLRRFMSWHVRERLDLEAMHAAAAHFVGRHDFAAFRASNCATKTSVRRIDAVDIVRDGETITIDVIGEGFLKNMVRVMAGTLVDIGKGRFAPEHVAWLLANPDRKKAGVTAPACGLCLIKVTYRDDI